MDVYPGDLLSTVRQLQADVAELQALMGARPAATEASQGWILRAMGTPAAPPAGDVHIYASGGQLWARSTFGTVALESVPQGTAPDPLTGQTGVAGNVIVDVGGSHDQAALNRNFRAVADKINEVIDELASAGFLV